ncbi:MAG TPA: hypothetical protein VM223_25815, partial [Planctomycetota bacterium]|nr:hypothetical protein [Planctomycetota bacterium]
LFSPSRFEAIREQDLTFSKDHSWHLPFWDGATTQAFDEICGLTPRKGWLVPREGRDLCLALEELLDRAGRHALDVATDPELRGTPYGARQLIRDLSLMFYAARVLQQDARDIVREISELAKSSGAAHVPHVRRQLAIISAFAGSEGALAQWYRCVNGLGEERDFDMSLGAAYLAGGSSSEATAKAVAWGGKDNIEVVLESARRRRRTVANRWGRYIRFALNSAVYRIVPDLESMVVGSWPVELAALLGIEGRDRRDIEAKLEQFLEECDDHALRAAAERSLKAIRDSA